MPRKPQPTSHFNCQETTWTSQPGCNCSHFVTSRRRLQYQTTSRKFHMKTVEYKTFSLLAHCYIISAWRSYVADIWWLTTYLTQCQNHILYMYSHSYKLVVIWHYCFCVGKGTCSSRNVDGFMLRFCKIGLLFVTMNWTHNVVIRVTQQGQCYHYETQITIIRQTYNSSNSAAGHVDSG